jgi:hypothetical protein
MFGAKRLSLNRNYGCRVTPNIGLVLGSQFSVLSQPFALTENWELILVELTGIEPVASWLQTRRSPS